MTPRGGAHFAPAPLPCQETAQTELDIETSCGEVGQVAQDPFPDDLDQSLEFDPAVPEPIPQDDFDQNWGA